MYGFDPSKPVADWLNNYILMASQISYKNAIIKDDERLSNNLGDWVSENLGENVNLKTMQKYINLYSDENLYASEIRFITNSNQEIILFARKKLTDDSRYKIQDTINFNKTKLKELTVTIKNKIEKKCITTINYINKNINSRPKKIAKYKNNINEIRKENSDLKCFSDYAIFKIFIEK